MIELLVFLSGVSVGMLLMHFIYLYYLHVYLNNAVKDITKEFKSAATVVNIRELTSIFENVISGFLRKIIFSG